MPEPIQRGRHSVLYNYGVNKVFYHEKSRLVERVTAIQQDPQTPPLPINLGQLRARLRHEVDRFVRADIEPDQVRDIRVNVYQPDWVVAEADPRAFYCQRCGHLYIGDGPPRRGRGRNPPNVAIANAIPDSGCCACTASGQPCGGRLVQYDILTTHNCGASVFVPAERGMGPCAAHGTTHLHWLRQGSERAARWRIQCKVGGCTHIREAHQSFFAKHYGCPLDTTDNGNNILDSDEKSFFSAPHMKATHYMGRVINLLNSDNSLPDLQPNSRQALVAALGVLRDTSSFKSYDPAAGLEEWLDKYAVTEGDDAASLEELEKQRAAIEEALPPGETRDAILKRYDEQIQAFQRSSGPAIDASALSTVLSQAEYTRQIRDSVLYMDNRRGYDLAWLRSQTPVDMEYVHQLDESQRQMRTLHIHDVRYQEGIPMTAALIGYTRGDYNPRKAQLKLFMPRGFDGGVDVYAHRTTTEGLWVQLDPVKTLSWLAARTGRQIPIQHAFPDALLTLQQHYQPESFDAFGRCSDPWTQNHYALLHTISHLFIKAAGRVTGLEQEGVSEEILPYSNSFVIYANHSGEFVLGGLQIMMEYHLASVLGTFKEEAHRCVYNPVCESKRSACHGCVHVAEVSCSNFNRTLGRNVLVDDRGFWT